MTPAVQIAQKAKISFELHSYLHDPLVLSYGMEAAEKLGVEPERIFKTLIARLDEQEYVAAVIPVSTRLNLKRLAKAAGSKKAEMADGGDVERLSGYLLGGVSPLGQKKWLRTFIDASASECPTLYVSAGRRGVEIELSPADLIALTRATLTALGV